MIRTKDIFMGICNSRRPGHQLTADELARLQRHLMVMYKDLEAICERHNLRMCLGYGNVIGAMRHNGWIPWDDDLDVIMPRADYDLLIKEYISELPDYYKVYSVYSEDGPITKFTKIVDTRTVFSQIVDYSKHYNGVFIDIFPMENLGANCRMRKLKKYTMMFMMYTVSSVAQYKLKDPFYKEVMMSSKAGRNNYWFRHCWGMFFSVVPLKKWYKWIDRFPRNTAETGIMHIPLGTDYSYRGFDASVIFPPVKKVLSDGASVYLPGKTEEYLDLFYKNWREIPDSSDRWQHYVKEFYIPNNI